MKPYHFSLLRYMHSVVAGELVNIGLVMWLPSSRRVLCSINEKYSRLSSFYPVEFDGTEYRRMIREIKSRFDLMAEQMSDQSHRGFESFPDVLEALMPANASCFQWSSAMAGLSQEPELRFQTLVDEFVERYNRGTRPRRDETEMRYLANVFKENACWYCGFTWLGQNTKCYYCMVSGG